MKEYRQEPGGRRVKGEDLKAIQEIALLSEKLLAQYGSFIISGCELNGTNINSGIVMLDGKTCTFSGASDVALPYYIKKSVTSELVPYESQEKGAGYEIYSAVQAAATDSGAFRLDNAPRFENIFVPQKASHANTATTAEHASAAAVAEQLKTARAIWGQSFNGTSAITGTLIIDGNNSSHDWTEGIRIKPSGSGWAVVALGSTTDNGPEENQWGIFRKSNNDFAIGRSTASDGSNGIVITKNGGNVGVGTVNPEHKLHVEGGAYFRDGIKVPYAGSSFLSMATRTSQLTGIYQTSQHSAHSLYTVKSFSGNAISFGGLGDDIGFYGFSASRIAKGENGVDWSSHWNTNNGNSYHTGSVTAAAFFQNSDERLKDIKEEFEPTLEDITRLPLFYYALKSNPDKQEVGTSAQKVMDKFPELVAQDDNGYYSVAYDKLAILALKGISLLQEELRIANDKIGKIEQHLGI